MSKLLKTAVKITLPVLFGYLVLGMAFGLMLEKEGYNFIWAFFISLVVYAGSMQFVLVKLLAEGMNLLSVAIMTLTVNSRHIFYGLSFLKKFEKMGKAKWYMIFSLTDETYSLLSSLKAPKGVDEQKLMFAVAVLDHSYWILGGVIGALAGQFLNINTMGVDFSLTALLTVIFIDQWREYKSHLPVLIATLCGGVSLIIAVVVFHSPDGFIMPALISTVLLLLGFRSRISQSLGEDMEEIENAG